MARSRVTSRGVDLTKDNGAILQSLIAGEQLRSQVTLKWFTSLDGATVSARIIEADNSDLEYAGGVPIEYPTEAKSGATVKWLPLRYISDSDSDGNSYRLVDTDAPHTIDTTQTINSFEIVWDDAVSSDFSPQPKPDQPVYAYFSLEVRDSANGELQQIYKPMRGLVEYRFSVDAAFR